MSKLDSIQRDLDVALADYDRLLSLSLLISDSAEEHVALERLGVRIAVLQQQLSDAEEVAAIMWEEFEEDEPAKGCIHVANVKSIQ
jgi:hypothetical protein